MSEPDGLGELGEKARPICGRCESDKHEKCLDRGYWLEFPEARSGSPVCGCNCWRSADPALRDPEVVDPPATGEGDAGPHASGVPPVEADRQRIWTAIQAWEETAAKIDTDGAIAPIEGFTFQPLQPFFSELRAIVFDVSDRERAVLDNPELLASLERGMADAAAGRVRPWSELSAEPRRRNRYRHTARRRGHVRLLRLAPYNPEIILCGRWRIQYAPAYGWRWWWRRFTDADQDNRP